MTRVLRHRPSGFSLIEILLVLSLLSLLSLAIMTTFTQGIKMISRFNGTRDASEPMFFMERLTHDLKNAADYSAPFTLTTDAVR